jgi:peptide-methionine (R)-S-oxide reductase
MKIVVSVIVSFLLLYLLFSNIITPKHRIEIPPDTLNQSRKEIDSTKEKRKQTMKIEKSDAEWKKVLTPAEYNVLREKGTERPFTGEYWNNFEKGVYKCAACGEILFKSDTKFDAGCGWPSFYEAIDKSKIEEKDDFTLGMHRIEVTCKKCGGHLGHVFPDGPKPTGTRYCINSVSIRFEKSK